MTSHNDTYDVTKWVIMTSCQHDLIYLLVVFLEGLEKLSQCLVTGSLAELLIALEQVCGGKRRKEWGEGRRGGGAAIGRLMHIAIKGVDRSNHNLSSKTNNRQIGLVHWS